MRRLIQITSLLFLLSLWGYAQGSGGGTTGGTTPPTKIVGTNGVQSTKSGGNSWVVGIDTNSAFWGTAVAPYVKASSGTATNLTVSGSLTAPDATSTSPSAVANVGTLDTRLRRRIAVNYGNGGSIAGPATITSSNVLYSTFNAGFGFVVPPHYTKVVSYTYHFWRQVPGVDLPEGSIQASPAIGSVNKYNGSIAGVKLKGMGTIATFPAMTNSAFVISMPALGTNTLFFLTNINVNQSIRNNTTVDGMNPWTNGYLFAHFNTINLTPYSVTGLWVGCTVVLEEED